MDTELSIGSLVIWYFKELKKKRMEDKGGVPPD
jgi:hypothetical protein